LANVEINGEGKAGNRPGLYRHPESGAEVFVTHHPKLGAAMADGVVQVGYKWVSYDQPKKETKKPESKETPKTVKK
jgi:hypothetical protein